MRNQLVGGHEKVEEEGTEHYGGHEGREDKAKGKWW